MIEFDPGSFKDPAGRVFYHGSSVFRTLSDEAHRAFINARTSGLVADLINQKLLIDTELVSTADAGLPATLGQAVLKQRQIPVVTYAYEWSFEMLRDAALVTLRILDRSLAVGFVLKDATAFNILFDGTIPKLVDVPSIEPYREGQIWAGYSQFCRSFLFPLLVSAYRDIDIQPLLRGTLGELPVSDAARLLGPRHWSKPGVLKDVVLQARLDRTFAKATHTVKSTTSTHVYPKPVLVASIRRLLRLIEGLKAPASESQWSAYDTFHTYTDADRQTKLNIVETLADQGKGGRLVDLGCNTGEYSLVATRNGAHVVALDMDSRAIDRLYRKASPAPTLSPVVATLLNPTPAMGWGLRERRSLFERLGCGSISGVGAGSPSAHHRWCAGFQHRGSAVRDRSRRHR